MDIVYAAEKPSIARLFSERMRRYVQPEELRITENPDETGSFYIGWQLDRYVMSPDGGIARDSLSLVD
ncbi:MAG: hypothetical protein ACR2Q3_12975 [Woeseiaceae bacterium]